MGTPSPRGGLQPRGLPLTLAQGTDRASPCRSRALSAGFTQMRPVSVPQGWGSDTSSIGSGSGGWKWRPRCTLYETFNDLRKQERRAQGRHKGQRDRMAAQKLTGRLCQRVWGGAEAIRWGNELVEAVGVRAGHAVTWAHGVQTGGAVSFRDDRHTDARAQGERGGRGA